MTPRPAVIIEEEIVIPATVGELQGFRDWSLSKSFPERGRIDFLQGTIEVDMSPENLQKHGLPKTELSSYIHGIVKRLGNVYSDRARLVHPAVGLSCEPDIVYVSYDALRDGRVRYVKSKKHADEFMEIEGAATLVVEIVSESSVYKDLERLPKLYAQAGIGELWIVDARGDQVRFEIRQLVKRQWRSQPGEFQESRVLKRRLRLVREPGEFPLTWQYFVDEARP